MTRLLEPTKVEDGKSSTRVMIVKGINRYRLYFEVPLEIYLKINDRIEFYQGSWRRREELNYTKP